MVVGNLFGETSGSDDRWDRRKMVVASSQFDYSLLPKWNGSEAGAENQLTVFHIPDHS